MKISAAYRSNHLGAARWLIGAFASLMLAMAVLVPGMARAADSGAKQALIERVHAWDRAASDRDTKALDRILADDFTITLANGQVESKRDYLLRFVKAPQMTLDVSDKSTDIAVSLHGATAIVTGQSSAKQPYRGPKTIGQYRFTDVYVKRNGTWRAVASQLTRVDNPAPNKSVPSP